MPRFHSGLYLSSVSSWRYSLAQDVELWSTLGVKRIGLATWILDPARAAEQVDDLLDRGFTVSSLLVRGFNLTDRGTWQMSRDLIAEATFLAARCAAQTASRPVVSMLTGRNPAIPWPELVSVVGDAITPLLELASDMQVPLAVEHTHTLRADVSAIHTVTDAADLARALGLQVNVDLNACWAERDIAATLTRLTREGLTAMVQLSDHRHGTTATGQRAVPGDGDVPLLDLVRPLVAAGFSGPYELELLGDTIETEGYENALRRGMRECDQLLRSAGLDG